MQNVKVRSGLTFFLAKVYLYAKAEVEETIVSGADRHACGGDIVIEFAGDGLIGEVGIEADAAMQSIGGLESCTDHGGGRLYGQIGTQSGTGEAVKIPAAVRTVEAKKVDSIDHDIQSGSNVSTLVHVGCDGTVGVLMARNPFQVPVLEEGEPVLPVQSCTKGDFRGEVTSDRTVEAHRASLGEDLAEVLTVGLVERHVPCRLEEPSLGE